MKKIIGFITAIFIFTATFNSCSTGSDPEPIVSDLFKIPINYALQFTNIANDIATEVNAIALNHLKTTKDEITSNVVECVTATVNRKAGTTNIESIVINYGNLLCSSNGANFLGKIIVKPTDSNLKEFTVTLSGLKSTNFTITGDFKLTITGEKGGDDFTISSTNLKYSLTDKQTDKVYNFPISNYTSSYKFVKSEDLETDYIDDIFSFTTKLEGTMPDGTTYILSSDSGLTFAYKCKNIIGGTAQVELTSLDKGIIDFGGGDTVKNCDNKVTISIQGIQYSATL